MSRDKQILKMAKVIHQAEMEDMMLKVTGDIDYLIDAMPMNVYVAQELYNKGYRKASDVAREIFEEIENILHQNLSNWVDGVYRLYKDDFDKLKKKYESEEADDFPNCKISGCEAAHKDCHLVCPYGKGNKNEDS